MDFPSMLPLHRMILETVVYYDVFDYPLTEFEVWQLLLASDGEGESVKPVRFRDVLETLDGSFLSKRLGRYRGFVFVRGRDRLVSLRIARQKRADESMWRARRVAWIMRFFPFVRMAGLTGSLSMKNADSESDWDFFLVIEAGHIWTGRAVATALLHVLGLRRHGKKVARRACLNFWVTTDSLEIRLKDIFSSSEYLFLVPILDNGTFEKFQKANAWMRRFRPHFECARLSHQYQVFDTNVSRRIRSSLECALSHSRLESFLRTLQQKKIASNPKTRSPEGIIDATDTRLVFLPHPRGPKIFEAFRRRLSDVEISAMSSSAR